MPKHLLRVVLGQLSLGCIARGSSLTVILFGLYGLGFSMNLKPIGSQAHKTQLLASPISNLEGSILAGNLWVRYTAAADAVFKKWPAHSAKILFEVTLKSATPPYAQTYLVVGVKKAHGREGTLKEKDGLWEFPGGRSERGEDSRTTLLRELSEEDPSLVLRDAAELGLQRDNRSPSSGARQRYRTGTRTLYYRTLQFPEGEKLSLFKTSLTAAEWQRLQEYWSETDQSANPEVYRFELVPAEAVESQYRKKAWTPKSRKILAALRRRENSEFLPL